MDKCLPFFKVLKWENMFQWMEECEMTLQALKKHLGQAPCELEQNKSFYPTLHVYNSRHQYIVYKQENKVIIRVRKKEIFLI